MSNIALFELYIKEFVQNGTIKSTDYSYLLLKSKSLDISDHFIKQYLELNEISIIETQDSNKNTQDFYADINIEIRSSLESLFYCGKLEDVIRIFEEQCFDTRDIVLVKLYLNSVLNYHLETKPKDFTSIFISNFSNNIEILQLCAEINGLQQRYVQSLECYIKANSLSGNFQAKIDEMLSHLLDNNHFLEFLEIPLKETPLDRSKVTPAFRCKLTPLFRSKLTPAFWM